MDEDIKECEKCHHNRWKTIEKKIAWECRNCGNVRSAIIIHMNEDDPEWQETTTSTQ